MVVGSSAGKSPPVDRRMSTRSHQVNQLRVPGNAFKKHLAPSIDEESDAGNLIERMNKSSVSMDSETIGGVGDGITEVQYIE